MLLIGYGNAGRGDDGLGPALAERIAGAGPDGLAVEIDYQLCVDHAAMVSRTPLVVFADAQMPGPDPFRFAEVSASSDANLSSHSLTPGAVLALARTLYGATPRAFVLGITGSEFGEVHEGLSAQAQANLARAETFFCDWLRQGAFRAVPAAV